MTISEAQTRQRYIDSQLAEAGWGHQERCLLEEFELVLEGSSREDGTEYGKKYGYVD
jgi:type I site-specific restriction endonuclease